MRKVTYFIDDDAYYRELFKEVNNLDGIMNNVKPFRCVYSLIGYDNSAFGDWYELTDEKGNKININDLNGYQRGVVLCDCSRHFGGRKMESETNMPVGCVRIEKVHF